MIMIQIEEKKLLQQKENDWHQYEETIANKITVSWDNNIQKLQTKFSTIDCENVIPGVKKVYLDKHPNDQTIKQLFATKSKKLIKPSSKSKVNGNKLATDNKSKPKQLKK